MKEFVLEMNPSAFNNKYRRIEISYWNICRGIRFSRVEFVLIEVFSFNGLVFIKVMDLLFYESGRFRTECAPTEFSARF